MGQKVEGHKVAGVSFRQKEIQSLGKLNPQYQLSKKEIASQIKRGNKTLLDESIYKYIFQPRKTELIPEPSNPHDPNAVKVVIDGVHVGYIKQGSCTHIKKLISSGSILSIQAVIKGGEYKFVAGGDDGYEELDIEKDKTDYYIKLSLTLNEDVAQSSSTSKTNSKTSTNSKVDSSSKDFYTILENEKVKINGKTYTKKEIKKYKNIFLVLGLLLILISVFIMPFGIITLILGMLMLYASFAYSNVLKKMKK